MTLFEIIQVRPPITLTKKGKKQLQLLSKQHALHPERIAKLFRDGVEGLQEALHLSKSGTPFFDEMIDKELN